MSESESENESDLDFSASEEDEYVPSEDEDSDENVDDDDDSEDDTQEDDTEVDNEDATRVASSSKRFNIPKQKRNARKVTEDDNDSDSSVENYLVNPNEIDLASDFFNPTLKSASNVPQFDCNIGLNLSDSEEEIFEDVPSTSRDAAIKLLDFNAHENFNKDLESAKEQLRNFKSTNFGQENCENDVTKLLAIGEPSLQVLKSPKLKRKKDVISSDESDFEQVEDDAKINDKNDVEVRIGPAIKQKPNKYQAEIEASIKRKINRRKKENQLLMHKVHLLSWIGYGNQVNKILNSTKLMEMVVKYIPSEKCYPKEKTDQQYFEQIVKWYKTTVGLKSKEQNCSLKCLPPLATSLALQIQSKMAICKKDFVFIFVVLLRSIGIQCRLVVNLATLPMRPPASELLVISLKNADKSKDNAKEANKSKKKKESIVDKPKEKDSPAKDTKPKLKSDKLKGGNSISGTVSKISTESLKSANAKKSAKTKIEAAVKSTENQSLDKSSDTSRQKLKRGVSVQSTSSVNDNNSKRSRNDTKSSNNPLNGTDKKLSKRRSLSLQSPSSVKSKKPSKLNVFHVMRSPIKRRAKQSVANYATSSEATMVSTSVPQLDGGHDTRSKKEKPQLSKLKSSPPSNSEGASKKSKSVTTEPNGSTEANKEKIKKAKPNLLKIRSSSQPTSVLKSPIPSKGSVHKQIESTEINKVKPNLHKITQPSMSGPVSKSPTTIAKVSAKRSKSATTESKVGKNKNNKKVKRDLFKIRLPSRSASVSRSPSPVKFSTKLDEPNSSKLAGPSRSRSISKSPAPTSRSRSTTKHTVKSTTNSDEPDSSKLARLSRSRSIRKSPAPTTEHSVKFATKLKTDSISNNATTLTVPGEQNKKTKKDKSKPSTSNAVTTNSSFTSPIKSTSASNSDDKLSSKAIVSKSSSTSKAPSIKSKSKSKLAETKKNAQKHKATETVSSDSDFVPTPKKKPNLSATTDKPLPKAVEKLKKRIDRRVLSTDDESIEPAVKKTDMNYWIEVYCEADSKWICIDLFKSKVNSIDIIRKNATKPIAYVFAWNNSNSIKDVSPRYCSQWNTTTRKLRVPNVWLNEALARYQEPISQRCVAEDRELEEIHSKTPIPTSISELKNHPLYVLPRHLLKFEGIYPPNPIPVAFVRDEPIYSRLCVHTLHSREIWVKQARTVKPGEIPYKIVKARPKWDRLANKMLEPLPLEIFGYWQTQPYEPPVAENGIVPRNAYGNVELFKPEMLPINTVHLRLPGLNRVCAKLKIDCAQAVVGFDFHGGSSHPTFDGFVVCEEFQELVTMRWWEEQEEAERRSKEKQNKRIYDNWKKLIKGLLIRQRLQRKYDFSGKGAAASAAEKE